MNNKPVIITCAVTCGADFNSKRGVFARNEELVVQAVNIVEVIGCRVSTPSEAREILGIGQTWLREHRTHAYSR